MINIAHMGVFVAIIVYVMAVGDWARKATIAKESVHNNCSKSFE